MADSTGEDGGPAQVPTASAQVNEAQPAPAVEGAVDAPASHNATPDHASTATNGDAPQANSSSLEDTAAGKSKSASPAQQGSNEGAPIAPPATQAMDVTQDSATSTPQPPASSTPAAIKTEMADSTSSTAKPYGTRSSNRTRTGNARINYAEDQDMDFELTTQAPPAAAAAAAASATANANAKSASTTESKPEKAAASESKRSKNAASLNHIIAATGASPAPSPAPKEVIPGTSSFHSNPKKRKAGGKSATASNNSPRSTPGPAEAVARRAAAVPLPNNGREINMMTFMKSKAKLLGGKLIADDGTELGVNDHVYLVCEPPGDPYYLCRIMEFLHVKSGDASSPVDSLRVNWFYRPRDCLRYNNDSRLVYGTMHSDLCPLTSLRGKCNISHRSEIANLDEYRKQKDSFWFSQIFDRFIRRFYEVIPTSQIINVPEKVKKALDERWKFIAVEVGRVKELTSAVKLCKRCSGYCASHDSVDCAICKNSYHMNCVRPPLPKKPSRGFAWSCGPCSRAAERKLQERNTPTLGEKGTDVEEEEVFEEEEEDPALAASTRAPSPDTEMEVDQHPGTQAEIALAKMWPMRYLGIHCRVEDALQYDDRAIYPRASSRLGPRHQANVNVWHGRPVELVKPTEIKKRYIKSSSHKKDAKLSKETIAALEADRAERAKRPKWVLDEPVGYVHRGEDHPNKDSKNTAQLLFKMPPQGEHSERGLDDKPLADEKAIDAYMERAKQVAKTHVNVPPFGTNFLDKAIQLYYDNNYDAEAALKKLKKVDRYKDLKEPVLTKEELKKFEEGVAKYGSEHRLIRLHMKTDLPNSVIVRFYYLWKKTPQGKVIWGSYGGRKGKKKRPDMDVGEKLQAEVAHDVDDSAYDNDKAIAHKRRFQCKFCNTRESRQWRRAPGVSPGQTVPADKNSSSKDKSNRLILALCLRCAGLWRRYAIQWEDVEEVAKKVAQGGGRAWKRRIDEELLRELIAANEAAQLGTPEASSANASLEGSVEPPKKKSKTGDGETTTKKKEKPAPAPKQPTPPLPPIVPEQPKWRTLPCAVCKTLEIGVEQPISCAHCKLTVHKQCYGMADQVVPSKWVCDQCSNDRTPTVSTDYACTLCPVHETKLELFEPPKVSHKKKTDREREKERLERELIDKAKQDYTKRQTELNRPALPREPLKKTDGNNWMHVLCAVFTPEIRFSNARVLERAENQGMIPMSRYEMVCKVCKARDHQGACISCSHTGCNANFHVTCAHEAGYTFGFDVAPQKASRKDRQTVALGSETGYMTAAVWCKEHSVKTIVHPMSEMVDDTGRNALQLYVETYKQADIALTGTARKANLLSQSTKSTAPAIPAPASTIAVNRRVSIASTVATGRGARNSSLGLAAKTPEGEEGTPVSNTVSEAPERKCVTCGIDVSPKWWAVEKRAPTPGAERNAGNTTRETNELNHQSNGAVKEELREEASGPSVSATLANGQHLPGFQCHKCHWRKLNEPTPPPEPKRIPLSPPRQFPLQLGAGWMSNTAAEALSQPTAQPQPPPPQAPAWPEHHQAPPGAPAIDQHPQAHPDFRPAFPQTNSFAPPQPLQPNGVSYGQPPSNGAPAPFPQQSSHLYRPPHLSNLPPASQQMPNGVASPSYPLQSPTLLNRSSSGQGYAPHRLSESPFPPPQHQQQMVNGASHASPPPAAFARPATPRETSVDPRTGSTGGAVGGASASPSLRNLLH